MTTDPTQHGASQHPEASQQATSQEAATSFPSSRPSPSSPATQSVSLPVAILISGGGTTLRNLLEHIERGELALDVRVVISSNKRARGIEYARRANIPHQLVRRRDFATPEQHRDELFQHCRAAGAKFVVMGGYLEHVLIPDEFMHRVVNIHPSLIPAFCGQGYYGARVHEAVLQYGAKISGCTVHFVDNEYDHGPIILQRAVPVLEDDTPQSLGARVFAEECRAYPEALQLCAKNRIQVEGRQVRIRES